MVKKRRTSKAKKKPIAKRSKTPTKKRKGVKTRKRRYKRKKPKVSISKTSLALNILFIVIFGFIIYQSGILKDFTKKKSPVLKQPRYSKEKDVSVVGEQAKGTASPKKETSLKHPEVLPKEWIRVQIVCV